MTFLGRGAEMPPRVVRVAQSRIGLDGIADIIE
jgi:hypothetical protein